MRRPPLLAYTIPLALLGALVIAPAALATPQSGLGLTLDVTIEPGTQSGLEETAWLPPSGGTAVAQTSSLVTTDTTMTVTAGVTLLASCVISVGNNACGDNIPPLDPGATNVTYTFDDGTDSVTFSGVLFTVTPTAPTVTIEWQDADGDWIDGTGTAIPLLASTSTAGRCLVTNNSNAPATLNGFSATVDHPSDPGTVTPLTGTLAAGATQAFTIYTGPAGNVSGYSCSGGVLFPAASGGSGTGNGGTIVPIAGTLSASPLTVNPGGTVTVTGAGLLPDVSTVYHVTVNGAAAAGSPATLVLPGGDLSFNVAFPTAGTYTLAVHNEYASQDITFASFTVIVSAAEIADTGANSTPLVVLASLLLAVGAALLVVGRRLH